MDKHKYCIYPKNIFLIHIMYANFKGIIYFHIPPLKPVKKLLNINKTFSNDFHCKMCLNIYENI